MDRITIQSNVDGDGVLRISLPVGIEHANQAVRVTIEPVMNSLDISPEQWRKAILDTAGKWQGEFQRPEQGEYEEREWFQN